MLNLRKDNDSHRDNEWDEEWNSSEVQDDIMTTGKSRDDWEQEKDSEKYGQ